MQHKSTSLTIGVIMPAIHESCQSMIWPGISDFAREMGVKLVTYVATSQDQISSLDLHYEIIGDFVKNSSLDGVIIFTGAIGQHCSHDAIAALVKKIDAIPTVAIALKLPNTSTVLVENGVGIVEMMTHFIKDHH